MLETDIENVGDQYAFDNPGFKGKLPASSITNEVITLIYDFRYDDSSGKTIKQKWIIKN